MRLIDADGSTYEGVLRPVNEFGAKPTKSSPVLSVAPDSSTSAISSAEGVVLQNYMVVVSGTNRSLNQAVRFEGNLELTERQVGLGRNFFSNTIPPVAGKQAAKLPAQEAQLTPGHLRGNAVLDDGQNVKVDALLLAR